MMAAMALSWWAQPTAAEPTAPLPAVTVVAREAAFEAPATFPAGLVAITLVNEAPEQAEAQFTPLELATSP